MVQDAEDSDAQISNKNRMEWFFVHAKKNGETYIPKNIPTNRNKTTITCLTVGLSLFCFLVDIVLHGEPIHQLEGLCYGILWIFLVEFIYRIILLREELRNHFTSRYGNNFKDVFLHVFTFSWTPCLIFLITFIIFIVYCMDHGLINVVNLTKTSLALKMSTLCLLRKTMSLETAPIYSSLQMEVNNGLNYGSGMAYSFFHGYFKKVLAKACSKDENLQEKVEKYSDTQGVRFPVSKLLMLIPKSGTCFSSLKNDKFPGIEESSSLSEKLDSVGGVLDRVYKNSVYKIWDLKRQSKKKVYVCAEYASPLVTFKKGLESNTFHSRYYKVHQEDIILQFYLTLKYLVKKDEEISELCDLIYYDDKDENGEYRDLAQIILTRVRSLKKQLKKKQ